MMQSPRWTLMFVAGLLVLCAAPLRAHGKLVASSPASAAVLAMPPQTLSLEFSETMRLTQLVVQSFDGTSQDIKALPTDSAKLFRVAAPALGRGRHELQWRGVGADGHVVSGRIPFSIAASTQPSGH